MNDYISKTDVTDSEMPDMNLNDIISTTIKNLRMLPKEIILLIVLELMQEDIISFEEIAVQHARHLEALRKNQSKRYIELRSMIINTFHGLKKDCDKNLKEIMHDLLDHGELNTTHDAIDKH